MRFEAARQQGVRRVVFASSNHVTGFYPCDTEIGVDDLVRPDTYYGTHRSGPAVIVKGGLVWSVFTAMGWTWQDNASIDYQHFDTGYPSVPRTPR